MKAVKRLTVYVFAQCCSKERSRRPRQVSRQRSQQVGKPQVSLEGWKHCMEFTLVCILKPCCSPTHMHNLNTQPLGDQTGVALRVCVAAVETYPNPNCTRNSVQHCLVLKCDVSQACCHLLCGDRVVAGVHQLAVTVCHGVEQGFSLQCQ